MSRRDEGKGEQLGRTVGRKAERKLAARENRRHSVWFGLGMFGLVGWSVAVPAVLGALIGLWVDRHFPGRPSWTLTLLIIGVVLGCVNAWYWVRRESERQ